MNNSRKLMIFGTMASLVSVACWGAMPVFLRYLKDYIDSPWTMNMYRYGFAGFLYLFVLYYYRRKGELTLDVYIRSLVPTGINIAGQILWAMTPYYLESGLIGIFIRTSLIWTIIYSFFFFEDEREIIKKPLFWVGTGLTIASFLGISLSALDFSESASITGLAVVLVCSMFWGMYPVSIKKTMKNVDPKLSFGIICVNTAAVIIILGFIFGSPGAVLTLGAKPVWALFISAFLGIAFAHVVYYYALRAIGVVKAGNINMITPFYTILLSWLVLAEKITRAKIIFGLGIVAGVLIVSMVRKPPEPEEEQRVGR